MPLASVHVDLFFEHFIDEPFVTASADCVMGDVAVPGAASSAALRLRKEDQYRGH
jgi:hypothetical protein